MYVENRMPNQPEVPATHDTAPRLERIGVGLFTIPKLLDQDFAGTMKLLAEIGYTESNSLASSL